MAEHQSRDQRGPESSGKGYEIVDELLNSADEPPLAGQLDEHLDDVALHSEYRRLVAEQAALRRLGTLVARGGEPSEVSRAVAEEMRRCLDAFGGRRTMAL